MRKNLLYFSVLVLLACSAKKNEYVINGTIQPQKDGDYVMLFSFRGDSIFSIDTAIINQGTFRFKGKECLHDIAIVTTGNYPGIVRAAEVVLEKGEITVHLDSISEVSGTYLNDLYAEHCQIKGDDEKRLDFLKKNIANPVGRRLFKDIINNMQSKHIYEIAALIPDKFKSDPEIVRAIEKHKKYEEEDRQRKLLKGKKFIDFKLMTPSQEVKKLSEYVGHNKFVFIDFWASWCTPCIADVPNLKKAYDNYHEKGLEIIHISLDRNITSWRNVIKDVDAPWIHLSDLKGDSSVIKQAYNVSGIPHGILIDEEGTIIEPYIPGIILDQYMEMLLKQ